MEFTLLSVYLGIVSGILTSAILFLFGKIFTQIVLPWYRGQIYRGIDISGEWFLKDGDQRQKMIITQHAYELTATFYLTRDKNNQVILDCDGQIDNRFAYLSMKHRHNKQMDVGVMLVDINENEMKGYYLINDYKNTKPIAQDCCFMRN